MSPTSSFPRSQVKYDESDTDEDIHGDNNIYIVFIGINNDIYCLLEFVRCVYTDDGIIVIIHIIVIHTIIIHTIIIHTIIIHIIIIHKEALGDRGMGQYSCCGIYLCYIHVTYIHITYKYVTYGWGSHRAVGEGAHRQAHLRVARDHGGDKPGAH